MGARVVINGTAEEIRAQYHQLMAIVLPQYPAPSDAVKSDYGQVEGIKYRLYIPKAAAASGPLPVAIWTHGGGLVTGDVESDDHFCRTIAEAAPTIIINVEYRLAPEHRAPAQLEDSLKVYKWVSRVKGRASIQLS
jgi:versiconal hemiacetal acetate esterase